MEYRYLMSKEKQEQMIEFLETWSAQDIDLFHSKETQASIDPQWEHVLKTMNIDPLQTDYEIILDLVSNKIGPQSYDALRVENDPIFGCTSSSGTSPPPPMPSTKKKRHISSSCFYKRAFEYRKARLWRRNPKMWDLYPRVFLETETGLALAETQVDAYEDLSPKDLEKIEHEKRLGQAVLAFFTGDSFDFSFYYQSKSSKAADLELFDSSGMHIKTQDKRLRLTPGDHVERTKAFSKYSPFNHHSIYIGCGYFVDVHGRTGELGNFSSTFLQGGGGVNNNNQSSSTLKKTSLTKQNNHKSSSKSLLNTIGTAIEIIKMLNPSDFTGNDASGSKMFVRVVHIEDYLKELKEGSELRVVALEKIKRTRKEVVTLAVQLVGPWMYNLFQSNCENFTNFLMYDMPVSFQAKKFTPTLKESSDYRSFSEKNKEVKLVVNVKREQELDEKKEKEEKSQDFNESEELEESNESEFEREYEKSMIEASREASREASKEQYQDPLDSLPVCIVEIQHRNVDKKNSKNDMIEMWVPDPWINNFILVQEPVQELRAMLLHQKTAGEPLHYPKTGALLPKDIFDYLF